MILSDLNETAPNNEFVCQNCRRGFRFQDEAVPEIAEEELQHFLEFSQYSGFSKPDNFVAESFVLVPGSEKNHTEPQVEDDSEKRSPDSPRGIKSVFETYKKIMDISNANLDCCNPLCERCFEDVETNLNKQIEGVTNDIKKFEDVLREKNINLEEIEETPSVPEIQEQNEELERELQAILEHRSSLSQQMKEFRAAEKQLTLAEEKFLLGSNQFWLEIRDMDAEHARVKQRIRSVVEQLDMMKRTNVYDDAFHIYYDGHFGTISGLRLGRLDGQMVEWEEINAGLGQAMLLLDVLAARTEFKFQDYRLYPMGSVSTIQDTRKNLKHEMFGSNGLFGKRGLDNGLPCFLKCIKQLTEHASRFDCNFCPKYTIDPNRGLIGDIENDNMVHIQPSQGTNEEWTRALKYMLTNMKFLLAWVARYYPF